MDASAVVDGIPDIYLSGDADLEAIRTEVYQSLGLPLPEPVAAWPDSFVANHLEGRKSNARPSPLARNPFAARVFRALPIAAMIIIAGFAGAMTVKTFDTRFWPLAHPMDVSAATPLAIVTPAVDAKESPLQSLASRAALPSRSSRVSRSTLESSGFALIPAFEGLRDQMGAEAVGRCTDQATVSRAGDAQQPRTKGLFALNRTENWIGFTGGYRTCSIVPAVCCSD
jgi:hypothetical protein